MIGGNSVRGGLPRQWGALASVLLVHLGVLWWLQQGLSRELLPVITPITLISVPLDKPAPVVLPEPVPARAAPAPRQQPSPDKPAFIEVGAVIKPGSTVCVIEAMKLFNEIESEISGTIVKVLVNDSTPVEYDQPLFLVEPA